MENGKNPAGIVGLAFLAGATVGAAAGLLLAPQAGRKTRRLIEEKVDEAAEKIGEIKDAAGSKLAKIGLR